MERYTNISGVTLNIEYEGTFATVANGGQIVVDSSPDLDAQRLEGNFSRESGLELITFAVTTAMTPTTPVAIFNANVPFKMRIIDATVQATATSGSGTLRLTDGTNNITDAMICAVDTTMVRAGTINDAYSTLDEGDTLKVVGNGDTDEGLVSIYVVRVD